MATEVAEISEQLASKLDLSSNQQQQSLLQQQNTNNLDSGEEDGVEIIITPKRKDTVCSQNSEMSSCLGDQEEEDDDEEEADQGVGSNKEEESNEEATSSESEAQVFFDAPDKLLKVEGFDPALRRDSGFEDNKKSKLTPKNSTDSVGTDGDGDGEPDVDGDGDGDVDADDDGGKNKKDKAEEADFVVPDEELTKKIVDQVEFYFSDASITKDAFLLKHVRRNKEGFVSLKLISCFKRVKHLTKDWRQVAHAIKTASKELEVNDVETKVRRKAPLPETDETTPSRTVVAYNLPVPAGAPNGVPTVESVAEIFNKFGEIALVRILRPGNPIPGDVKQFLGKHPEIGNCVCALVEFEKTEFAKKAVVDMAQDSQADWRGVKVLELALKPKREKAPKKKDERRRSENSQLSGAEREELEALRRRHQQQRVRRGSRVEVLRRDSYTWGSGDSSPGISGSESDGSMYNLAGYPQMPPRRYSYVSTPSSASSSSLSPCSPCCSSPSHAGAARAGGCFCFARSRGGSNPFDFAPNGGSPVAGPMLSPQYGMSPPAMAPTYYHAPQQQPMPRSAYEEGRSAPTSGSWRSNKPAHQVYLAPAMVPGHHQPLSRRHSDAATGLTVPDNVLRLPKGPDPSAGRGFRSSGFAHWTQPNRFQQKGRSGSVPTVVFTRYQQAGPNAGGPGGPPHHHHQQQQHQQYHHQQPQQQQHPHQQVYVHPNAQHQHMEMPMHAGMDPHQHQQAMHMEQPQYVYQQPIQITHPPPTAPPTAPVVQEQVTNSMVAAPVAAPTLGDVGAQSAPAIQGEVVQQPPPEVTRISPPPETIPETPAAEAAATEAEN